MSAGLKRGFITARIGQSEGHHLPSANVQLTNQTDEKQRLLRELCKKYEKYKDDLWTETKETDELAKRLSSLQNMMGMLEKESERRAENTKMHLMHEKERSKEIFQLRTEKKKEKIVNEQLNKKLNMMSVRLQLLSSTDHEMHMKQTIIKIKIQKIEDEKKQLISAFTKDDHILRDLRDYLSQIAKNVFEQQQQLDHMQIGIKASHDDLQNLQKKKRIEKRNQMNAKAKVEQIYRAIQLKEEHVEQMQTEEQCDENDYEKELEGRQAQIESLEEIWLGLDEKLITSEISLADFRTKKERIENKIKRLQAKINLLSMQPTPSLYKGFVSDGLEISFRRNKMKNTQKAKSDDENEERCPATASSSSLTTRQSVEKARLMTLETQSKYLLHTQNDFPAFIDYEQYDYVKKEIKDRDQFLKSAETQAEDVLRRQNVREERTTQSLISHVEALQKNIKNLQKVIEDKKMEHEMNMERIQRITQKIDGLQSQKELLNQKNLQIKAAKQTHIESLLHAANEQKIIAENERNELINQNRLFHRNVAQSKHQLALIVSWKNSLNYKELKELKDSREDWTNKVKQLEIELKNLNETLVLAKKSNTLLRDELKIVKPYEPETYEYELLKFEESQLDHQLADLRKKQTANALTTNGFFKFDQ